MRAIAFFDAQNLYYAAKGAYGYGYPDFDPKLLAEAVCHIRGFTCEGVRLYTGIHRQGENPFWHGYWHNKVNYMRQCGVHVVTRELTYRWVRKKINGTVHSFKEVVEKGIDVMLAVDLVSLAHQQAFDTALIFSQDQDLASAVEEVYQIMSKRGRREQLYSVLPASQGFQALNHRGINGTKWFHVRRHLYDQCRDRNDHRPWVPAQSSS